MKPVSCKLQPNPLRKTCPPAPPPLRLRFRSGFGTILLTKPTLWNGDPIMRMRFKPYARPELLA